MKRNKRNNNKTNAILVSSQKERKERIANGTWMGRGAIISSKKTYNRKRDRKIVY